MCVSRTLRKIDRFCAFEINLKLIFNSIFGSCCLFDMFLVVIVAVGFHVITCCTACHYCLNFCCCCYWAPRGLLISFVANFVVLRFFTFIWQVNSVDKERWGV